VEDHEEVLRDASPVQQDQRQHAQHEQLPQHEDEEELVESEGGGGVAAAGEVEEVGG